MRLQLLLLALVCLSSSTRAADQIPFSLKLETLSEGFDGQTCWVHARAGAVQRPGASPSVVLTMQKLRLTGSDIFYALHELRTDDLGQTWQGPTEHLHTLGRRPDQNGLEVGLCDFTPKWHAHSGKLLGTGHTVRYRDDQGTKEGGREIGYANYDDASRSWTPWKTVTLPPGGRFARAGAGCTQRVDLPDGDILLPIYFTPEGEKYAQAMVLRCGFDGQNLTVKEMGQALAQPTARGLGEPSLTVFAGRYYLTLRHDQAGYVTSSKDGLHFDPPQVWRWDDGTELGNYNTQQHWVTHAHGLFLVYTRAGAGNDHVFRHRAPLFIAQVDPQRLCVLRATEQVLVPEEGARLGNFGVTEVSAGETWVTAAEWMQTWGPRSSDYTIPMRYGSNNRVWLARIRWQSPNTVWDKH